MSQTQNQTQTNANSKIGTYLNLIVMVVLALSVISLYVAIDTYYTQGDAVTAGLFAGIGFIAMIICLFLLYQSRRQAATVKLEIPKVMTTIECQNKGCANKTVREFQRGDFVFKDVEVACGKCGGKQMITAIFKEVKEKEKTYAV